MSDPAKYRTQQELDDEKKRDPLFRARKDLEAASYGEEKLKALDAKVEEEVAAAVKFAEESPEPDASILESTTYAGGFAS